MRQGSVWRATFMRLYFLWVSHLFFQANSILFHKTLTDSIRKQKKRKERAYKEAKFWQNWQANGLNHTLCETAVWLSTDFTEHFTAGTKHGARLNTVNFDINSCKITFIVSCNYLKQCANMINLCVLSVTMVWKVEPWVSSVCPPGELPLHAEIM